MVKPIVMVDLDGVAVDFVAEYLRISRKLLGKPAKSFVITDFEFAKCGWTEAEVQRIFNYMKHIPDFWTTLEKLPKTNGLSKAESVTNLFFVTSRFSTDGCPTNYQSERWLRQQYGLQQPYVMVSSEKGKTANELDADYAIDDRVENCLEIANARPECKVYVLDQPWNQKLLDKRITRITTLNEFLKEITRGD